MLPKPIIRNDVDVSRCSDLGSQYNCTAKANMLCETFPKCYFKQLQRKTIECNRLKQALEEIYKIIVELLIMQDIKHLSKEMGKILDIIAKVKDGKNVEV